MIASLLPATAVGPKNDNDQGSDGHGIELPTTL
jgi:hypothetical protein